MIKQSRVLIVEDEEIIAALIERTMSGHGYAVISVGDAASAWAALSGASDFDAVLLDRGLPDMDGLDLLRKIKGDARFRHLPVVVETGLDDEDSIREGLAAGAYYYLTKPLHPESLLAVIAAAIAQRREFTEMELAIHEAGRPLRYLESGCFSFRTLKEARELAQGLAQICPDPGRSGLGLQELLINAVEHGNLGISYADKTQLMIEDRWLEEVRRREDDPAYASRQVKVSMVRSSGLLSFTIKDEGEGFSWRDYLELSPERAFDPHGRGIALARMSSFDSMEYQGNGNTVTVSINTEPD